MCSFWVAISAPVEWAEDWERTTKPEDSIRVFACFGHRLNDGERNNPEGFLLPVEHQPCLHIIVATW
jgi:hypothetical protein